MELNRRKLFGFVPALLATSSLCVMAKVAPEAVTSTGLVIVPGKNTQDLYYDIELMLRESWKNWRLAPPPEHMEVMSPQRYNELYLNQMPLKKEETWPR